MLLKQCQYCNAANCTEDALIHRSHRHGRWLPVSESWFDILNRAQPAFLLQLICVGIDLWHKRSDAVANRLVPPE